MLNRRMLDMASQVIAVTDGSKFERRCMHKIVDVSDLDILITDSSAAATTLDGVRAAGVEVLIV
jgi:DeoR family transcriptional regulator of aga operon